MKTPATSHEFARSKLEDQEPNISHGCQLQHRKQLWGGSRDRGKKSKIIPPFPPSPLPTFSPSYLPAFILPCFPSHRVCVPHCGTLIPRRPPGAFTLVELMVAGVITTILLMGMTGIFDQSMKAWRLASRRADAEREVRAALSTLKRDLGGAIVTINTPMYIGVVAANRVGISSVNLPNLAPTSASGTWSNVSTTLFFASAQRPDSITPGDVSGVGYYVAWDQQSNEGRGAYNLYRYFQPASAFFANMTNFVASGTLYVQNNQDEIVGANVLNFWAQLVQVLPSLTASPTAIPPVSPFIATNTTRPSYIQMELTAYGSEAVRSFNGKDDWGNTNNIKKYGRSFIWRVSL